MFELFKDGVVLSEDCEVLLFLGGQLSQRKIFADLLYQLFPVAFGISIGFIFSCAFPIGVREDGLEVAEVVVMLLPFCEQLSEGVKQILLIFNSHPELTFLDFRVFSDTINYSNLFVNFRSNRPVVLCEVIDQAFAGVPHALPPESAYCGHLKIEL
jgi:hypothetical protein